MVTFEAFNVGDVVRFKGIRFGEVEILPQEGVLEAVTNTLTKGTVAIADKTPKMIFNPDGTLYCHIQYGVLLERIRDEEKENVVG